MPHEPVSDRTSVGPAAGGMIRLRTPEGQELCISVVRACEWLADTNFKDRLRAAVNASPCPFRVITPEDCE